MQTVHLEQDSMVNPFSKFVVDFMYLFLEVLVKIYFSAMRWSTDKVRRGKKYFPFPTQEIGTKTQNGGLHNLV
jgi:hypothetical protein